MLPIICKIIQAVLRERIRPVCDKVQNKYQRDFTKNYSPLNTGLTVNDYFYEKVKTINVLHI